MPRWLPRSGLTCAVDAGVVIFALGHMVSVWAARRDPQFVDVARRHLRFPTYLRV
jgi:type IV secretion system protein VirB3